MSTRAFWVWAIAIAAADAVFAALVYARLPERVPIHWNIEGEPDGWGSRATFLWMGPGLIAFGLLLALALPYLSPARFKIDPFRETFHILMLFVLMLFGYIHAFTSVAAMNPGERLGNWLVVGIFVFLSLIGNLLGRVKPNFYVGIRTPWTLADEEVWRRTHRLGGKLMFWGGLVGAILAAANLLIPAFVVLLVPGLSPVVYSFVISKRLESST